jgi:metal-dependent amidase/aminoacylase/carboxypeptidase family protein
MSHPSTYDGCFLPTIAIHAFDAEFFGKAAHASIAPWDGINALDGLIQAFNNINALRQSIFPTMRIQGIISEGGTVPNIIPYRPFVAF